MPVECRIHLEHLSVVYHTEIYPSGTNLSLFVKSIEVKCGHGNSPGGCSSSDLPAGGFETAVLKVFQGWCYLALVLLQGLPQLLRIRQGHVGAAVTPTQTSFELGSINAINLNTRMRL